MDAHYLNVEIRADRLEDMTTLGLFLLLDRKFRQRVQEIRAYFAAHHWKGHGYSLREGEIVLAVSKMPPSQVAPPNFQQRSEETPGETTFVRARPPVEPLVADRPVVDARGPDG